MQLNEFFNATVPFRALVLVEHGPHYTEQVVCSFRFLSELGEAEGVLTHNEWLVFVEGGALLVVPDVREGRLANLLPVGLVVEVLVVEVDNTFYRS